MRTLVTTRPPGLSTDDVVGFGGEGSVWRLDLDRYGEFVETVTGIAPHAELSASDCYRVGNRIEAFVHERRRAGTWTPDLVANYPGVDSLDQITLLARFFRRRHEERLAVPESP
jgi:hypothetical protein